MQAKHHQIIIVGAGTGGITVAARLMKENKKLDVAIIDPSDKHYYQPAFTLVAAGTYNYKTTIRDTADLIPKGVNWIKDYVEEIYPDQNEVVIRSKTKITYDYLVVCPGVQNDLDGIEGLEETLGKNNVCSNYTDPNYTWEVLQNFKGGTAIFTQPATPIKCGGAPQKIMYLADDYFRKTGVRKDTTVIFATPGSVIFGVEPFKQTLMKVVDRKDINLRFFHKLVKIDGEKKEATYAITAHQNEPEKLQYNRKEVGEKYLAEATEKAGPFVVQTKSEVTIPFDMLHLAPPQSAPDFIKRAKLSYKDGPDKGWVNVDHYTMQHNEYENVFGLGDACALPTAKTGAAIRKQAPVVVENLLRLINGNHEMDKGYEGYSSCPLITGYGKMVLAEFKYENLRDSDPVISKFMDTAKESYSMWLLKKYGLPFMYWNLMLKGKA
jgi:sulfide:quinone oxidoreductase